MSKTTNKDDAIPSCFTDTHGIKTSTTNDIAGYRVVKQLDTVYGLTVQARNWGVEIGAAFKASVGGEIRAFTNLLYTARNEAMDRMVGECMARGGNAILAVRFDVVAMGGWTQVCAYGTA